MDDFGTSIHSQWTCQSNMAMTCIAAWFAHYCRLLQAATRSKGYAMTQRDKKSNRKQIQFLQHWQHTCDSWLTSPPMFGNHQTVRSLEDSNDLPQLATRFHSASQSYLHIFTIFWWHPNRNTALVRDRFILLPHMRVCKGIWIGCKRTISGWSKPR